jgi:hypothetical protein
MKKPLLSGVFLLFLMDYRYKYVRGFINVMPHLSKGTPAKAKIKVIDKNNPTINKRNPNSRPIHIQKAINATRFINANNIS